MIPDRCWVPSVAHLAARCATKGATEPKSLQAAVPHQPAGQALARMPQGMECWDHENPCKHTFKKKKNNTSAKDIDFLRGHIESYSVLLSRCLAFLLENHGL